jgi:hypothetical protein
MLESVSVDLTAHVRHGVIRDLMFKTGQSIVGFQRVTIQRRTCFNALANLGLKCFFLRFGTTLTRTVLCLPSLPRSRIPGLVLTTAVSALQGASEPGTMSERPLAQSPLTLGVRSGRLTSYGSVK